MLKRMFAFLALMVLAVAGWVGFRSLAAAVDAPKVVESPQMVVEEFYAAYLDSMGDRSAGEFHNPLVEKTYRALPQLDATYVKAVDAELGAEEFIAADPFLCAQNVPDEVLVKGVEVNDDHAIVDVTTSFPNHQFSVLLDLMEADWKITAIHCE